MKRQNTEKLIQEIKEKGYITEQEINLLKRRANNGQPMDLSELYDYDIELTKEQTEKGFNFLMNQWKTKRGVERKNNPFGYREQNILNTFKYFLFKGLQDIGNNWTGSFFVPLYVVVGENGAFEYYYNFDGVNIIG